MKRKKSIAICVIAVLIITIAIVIIISVRNGKREYHKDVYKYGKQIMRTIDKYKAEKITEDELVEKLYKIDEKAKKSENERAHSIGAYAYAIAQSVEIGRMDEIDLYYKVLSMEMER